MPLTNKSLRLELEEDRIVLHPQFPSKTEILFSEMKKVHIQGKELAPLYKTLLVITATILSVVLLFLLQIEPVILLFMLFIITIIIVTNEFKRYELEIYLRNGQVLKRNIPLKSRREVVNNLYDIRKGIFYDQIGKDKVEA